MKILWQIARRNRVEIVVVAVDEVERRADRLVASLVVGEIADTQPDGNL